MMWNTSVFTQVSGACVSILMRRRWLLYRCSSTLAYRSQANALRKTLQVSVARPGERRRALLAVYDDLVEQGALKADDAQRKVARRLDKLSSLLDSYKLSDPQVPPLAVDDVSQAAGVSSHQPFSSSANASSTRIEPQQAAEGTRQATSEVSHSSSLPSTSPAQPPAVPQPSTARAGSSSVLSTPLVDSAPASRVLRGLYIHGQVGSGKSMLMDLFFHHCRVEKKRRVHFHEFMLEVHSRIHAWKQRVLATEGRSVHIDLRPERNAITQVAREIASEATVLCFDEFQVTDVADAVIMVRLFSELWACGVVMVATSNRAPHELYQDGINRPYFVPFLTLLGRQCLVLPMGSDTDHRLGFQHVHGSYHAPLGRSTDAALDAAFVKLAGGEGRPSVVPVMMGRSLVVPQSRHGVCRFDFQDLCRADVFAADYKAIASHFHTVVLSGVPRMSSEKHNEARRFITLIDVLYEKRTRLIMGADAAPHDLFAERPAHRVGVVDDRPVSSQTWMTSKPREQQESQEAGGQGERRGVDAAQDLMVSEGELSSVKELAFAFRRAASRLTEMSSAEYEEDHQQACAHLYTTKQE